MNELKNDPVLVNFQHLSKIPRESGKEKAVSDWIKTWAEEQGLQVKQDAIWNLIICKPASAGYEDHPPVMIQAHMDMVCEKDGDSEHDFTRDPISLKVDGDWLTSACGTTLGADNGIGVASAMAILEDGTLPHPPLEVIFTVQEETSFAGADGVDVSGLKGRRLINLDHAKERELIAGSCGGIGVEVTLPIERTSLPKDSGKFRVCLGGLKGGHSGEDIHRGRGNAITLLLRLLEELSLPVIHIDGGTNRLAIPREASAVILCEDGASLRAKATELENIFRKELGEAAAELTITCQSSEVCESSLRQSSEACESDICDFPLTEESFSRIAAAVRLYPNGIVNMNGSFEGLVECSDNLGILKMDANTARLVSEIRGGFSTTVEDVKKTIDRLAALLGGKTDCFNPYDPWEYEGESELRIMAADTYRRLFGEEMRQLVLHAGLECGSFARRIPGIDIISIGPDCENFHSPRERVSISSTRRFYDYLKSLLAGL